MYFSRVQIHPGISELSELADMLRNDQYSVHRMLWRLFPDHVQRTFIYREEIAREQLGASSSVWGTPIYYVVSKSKPTTGKDSLFVVESKNYNPQLAVGQKLKFSCRVNPVVTRHRRKHDVVMDAQIEFLSARVKKYRLNEFMSANPDKSEYKKLLLKKGGVRLEQELTELLAKDKRYVERLSQNSGLGYKLDWAIKAHIENALENWFERQGERCGFQLMKDDFGLSTLQNSAYNWHALPRKAIHRHQKSGFGSVDFTGELEISDLRSFKNALFNGLGRSKAFGCGLISIAKA